MVRARREARVEDGGRRDEPLEPPREADVPVEPGDAREKESEVDRQESPAASFEPLRRAGRSAIRRSVTAFRIACRTPTRTACPVTRRQGSLRTVALKPERLDDALRKRFGPP